MTTTDDLDLDRIRQAIAEARTTGDTKALRVLQEGLEAALAWRPQDYQRPPDGDWTWFVFSAGAGAGKTDAGAWWLDEHMKGPPCDTRVPGGHAALICGPTFGDAIGTCWKMPAGLSAHNPDVELTGRKDGTVVVWPNGAEALVAGLHTESDADLLRARAANKCAVWIDEGALGRHLKLAVDLISLRARLGKRPRFIVTSTPRPTPGWKHLLAQPGAVIRHASSFDNAYLPDVVRERIRRYEGTTWGLQEIHGQLVEYFEGALWRAEIVEADAIARDAVPDLLRIMIGVDPSTWNPDFGDDPGTVGAGLETGIVAAGVDRQPIGDQHAYVLEDASGRYTSEAAANEIIRLYHELSEVAPVQVVVERNLVGGVYDTVRLLDSSVKFYRDPKNPKRVGVHAADGKRARAEPVSAAYDKHRVHHVRDYAPGGLSLLEGQLYLWDPRENWSPDRLDAMVWALTALELWASPGSAGSVLEDVGRIARTRAGPRRR